MNVGFEVWALGVQTLLGALCLVFHLVLTLRILFAKRGKLWKKLIGLFPPLTPVAGWLLRFHAESVVWVVLLIGYVAFSRWSVS